MKIEWGYIRPCGGIEDLRVSLLRKITGNNTLTLPKIRGGIQFKAHFKLLKKTEEKFSLLSIINPDGL